MQTPAQRVVLIQEHLPHYRRPFFFLLRIALAAEGVELVLIHGEARNARLITEPLEWAHPVPLVKLGPFVWHRLGNLCKGADLIIVPQEVKYLRCHLLHLNSRMGGPPFAFWGHGKNFQSANSKSPAERVKQFLSRHVDWWFAYNDLSARIVADLGFPRNKITSVVNTVDTAALTKSCDSVTEAMRASVREDLSTSSGNIAIYTGALYTQKRIEFLLVSAILVRERIPDFELIVIGNGPDRDLVKRAASEHSWIHDLGPKNDQDKVPYWALSKVLLMPGGVGLVVLDSFALGVPMVTTDTHLHGPEIDYLRNNVNGLLVPCGNDSERYAEEVSKLMLDPAALARLRDGAINSASEYSIERMVDNFTQGVMAALAAPRI